jgi:antirestriction protein ArdC
VGNQVVIARRLVERIEKNPSMSWFYHVTLLHELAHWANGVAGTDHDARGEAGREFEERAYGRVLELP